MDISSALEGSASSLASSLTRQQSNRESVAYSALNRGATRIQEQDYEGALADFKRAAAYKPDMIEAQLYIARTYDLLDRTEEAITAYKKAIQIDPTDTNVKSELANYYMTHERYAEAEQELLGIMKTAAPSAGMVASLGYIYMTTDRLAEAEAQFSKAVLMAPTDPAAHYSLGLVYNKQERYEEAVGEFKKAIGLKRDYAVAYADLASSFMALDQTDLAQEQVDTLLILGTDEANSLAYEVMNDMFKPKILYEDIVRSTFPSREGPGTAVADLDPSLATPGSSVTFCMIFQFNKQMDVASVQDVYNWWISKADGGEGGVYNFGANLHPENEISILPIPMAVRYDPVTHRATVSFRITQNTAGTGLMDPSHWVFRFNGIDAEGNPMDTHGDEYDHAALSSF